MLFKHTKKHGYNLEKQGLFYPKYYILPEYLIYYSAKKAQPKINAAICLHYLSNHSYGLTMAWIS